LPTADDCKVNSGDAVEPPMPDVVKAAYIRVWPQLTAEDQELLTKWWKKNIGDEPTLASPLGEMTAAAAPNLSEEEHGP
jgi:hypothetical protein